MTPFAVAMAQARLEMARIRLAEAQEAERHANAALDAILHPRSRS